MSYEWILDVLADLRSFAHENDLPLLAEELDEAACVAALEITNRQRRRSALDPPGNALIAANDP